MDYYSDYDLSAAAAAAIANITQPEFPIIFASLRIEDKIEVVCCAEEHRNDILADLDIETAELLHQNISGCGMAIADTISSFSSKEKLWLIVDQDNIRPLYLPENWNDGFHPENESSYGFVAAVNYDAAAEIVENLVSHGINAAYSVLPEPGLFLPFLLEKYGYEWVCIASDSEHFVKLEEKDIKEKNDILAGLIARYSQRESVNLPALYSSRLYSEITEKILNTEFCCVVKETENHESKSLFLATKKVETGVKDEFIEFIPVYTSKAELDVVEAPFDYFVVRLPFEYLLDLSNELDVSIAINPETDFFVIPENIHDYKNHQNLEDEINNLLGDIGDLS